jgi:hypothetical protein
MLWTACAGVPVESLVRAFRLGLAVPVAPAISRQAANVCFGLM